MSTSTSIAPPSELPDARGSFQRQASSGLEDKVRAAASRSRRMVAISQARGLFTGAAPPPTSASRRVFRQTQSLPAFPTNRTAPPIFFEGTRDAYNNVIHRDIDGRLDSIWARAGSSSSARPQWNASAQGSFNARSITEETQDDNGGAGDGFDMDDVFPDSGVTFASFPTASGDTSDTQQSSEAITPLSTIGSSLRINSATLAGQGDVEMDPSADAEGEGEGADSVSFALNAPASRPLGGRRGFSKSQSLPVAVFSSDNF